MHKFKRFISSHKSIPLKITLITYVAWFLYSYFNEEKFIWFDNAVLMLGVFIIYIIFSIIASSLSFNKNKDADFFLNDHINESAIKIIENFEVFSDKENPKEMQIRRETIAKLLDQIGTMSSDETSQRIYKRRKDNS